MKDFDEYDRNEIVAIADKFANNEFVSKSELNLWYDYKRAVKSYIKNGEFWENHENQDSEIVQGIIAKINKARTELDWMRTIITFPLKEFCEYYCMSNSHIDSSMSYKMAQRVLDGTSNTENQFIREMFEESESLKSVNHFRDLKTPVDLREWTLSYNRATEYCPFETAMDCTQLYDGQEHYVYIDRECKAHKWGDTYWISVDCSNSLGSLPVIKDFQEYDFEIGHFYKITCVDTIYFGDKKKKYVMSIEETDEETFMSKGLIAYATRW